MIVGSPFVTLDERGGVQMTRLPLSQLDVGGRRGCSNGKLDIVTEIFIVFFFEYVSVREFGVFSPLEVLH